MKFPVTRFAVCVCLTPLLLVACATHPGLKTYQGPDRPASELILIKCDHSIKLFEDYKPYICAVDGYKALNDSGGPLIFPSVRVLPGEHTVEAAMGQQPKSQPGVVGAALDSMFASISGRINFLGTDRSRITFTAREGRTYELKGEVEEPEFWMWIEDAETEELVGGIRPPE